MLVHQWLVLLGPSRRQGSSGHLLVLFLNDSCEERKCPQLTNLLVVVEERSFLLTVLLKNLIIRSCFSL
jgi:hypothetical protein